MNYEEITQQVAFDTFALFCKYNLKHIKTLMKESGVELIRILKYNVTLMDQSV